MKARLFSPRSRSLSAPIAVALAVVAAAQLAGQNNPGIPLTLLSKDGRRPVPLVLINDQEFVALDDLAAAFQLTVREEGGALTVSYKSRTIVIPPDQPLASISGRLISLPAAPSRVGSRWAVPVEFISRALALIYDAKIDLRRPSHLVIVGDLRVPHVTMRYEPLANAARLTIDATPRAAPTVTQEAGRLTVKFDADAGDFAVPALQPQAFVQAIRVIDPATLDIELSPRFAAARTSTEDIENTTRLVIDLVGADTSSSAPPPAVPPPDLPIAGQAAPAIRTIAVDAGHGGDDEGTKGASGTLEKDLTLAVAKKLKAAVEARLGIRVLLTRDEDRNVPIDDRSAIANNGKADLFISLHANAALRGGPSGASVHVAAFETEDVHPLTPERVPAFGGATRDIELVKWDLAQIRYVQASTAMAHILEEQFQGRVPVDAQPFDAAAYRVLESANMPAVLVEMGYLTNADQEEQMAGADFQNALVQTIADSIVKFRDYLQRNPESDR